MEKKAKLFLAVTAAVCLFVWLPSCCAEQEPSLKRKSQGVRGEELLKLKNENPAKFKQVIEERRRQAKNKLEQIKQTDPERYQRVMEKVRDKRLQDLKKLKQENPEKFRELMEKRKEIALERLNKLRTENPDEFKGYLKNHPGLVERLRNIKEGAISNKQESGGVDYEPGSYDGD